MRANSCREPSIPSAYRLGIAAYPFKVRLAHFLSLETERTGFGLSFRLPFIRDQQISRTKFSTPPSQT
jgi:hypothetical protein